MLQSTTPRAEENKPPHIDDELDLLGRIYFDSLLRSPVLKSTSLSGLVQWGEDVAPSDIKNLIPLEFEGEIVGSLELRFDSEAQKEVISDIRSKVIRDLVPPLSAFMAWKQLTLGQRAHALSLLWELKSKFSEFDWVGIYSLQDDSTDLTIATYIGEPTDHIRIPIESGICGAAIRENDTVNVPDVLSDPRFIACSVKTRSELVVPIRNSRGEPIAEIDIDSNKPAAFTSEKVAAVQAAAFKLAELFGS